MQASARKKGACVPFLRWLSDVLNLWSERLLFALIVGMVAVTAAQVVFRFFFRALTWSEELSSFLLVLASLVGSAVAFKRGSHIAVTFLADKVPKPARKVLATFVSLCGFGFFTIVAVYGAILMAGEAGQLTPALQISMKWIYLMYPVTGAVTAVHLLDGIARTWEGGPS